jgi:hypothetical protein
MVRHEDLATKGTVSIGSQIQVAVSLARLWEGLGDEGSLAQDAVDIISFAGSSGDLLACYKIFVPFHMYHKNQVKKLC